MELHQAVTALAAFFGSYLGQRHAAAALAPALDALARRVSRLERYAARVSRLLARGAR
ncbi:hypothetical protein CYFUS_001698 [Cystobacter fuscus]|uniref:Uncharacterized protein n=1 Tax=Cystobacter fuscus TaxID=43 RepID=A0A250IX32_9BACT|nr:hypothetical protein CYFUS_001698 [Cystobacter fuscus]